jgi:hypothetical protein
MAVTRRIVVLVVIVVIVVAAVGASVFVYRSTPCTYTAEPIALALTVVSDTNQTPVVGASVTATNNPLLCHGAPETPRETMTFVTNSSGWHYLAIGGDSGYTFAVSYSGQAYHFSTTLYVEAATCVTLSLPSGRTNATFATFQSACPPKPAVTSTISSNPGGSSTSSSYDNITFTMTLNSSSIVNGSAVEVIMNLFNTLNKTNSVSPANDWQLTNQSEVSNSSSFGPTACSGSMGPYRVAVFSGFYDLSNYTHGTALSIFPWPAPSPAYNYCGTYIIEHSWIGSTTYAFEPESDNATLSLSGQGSWNTPMSLTVLLKPLNITFPVGQYTVVAGDEWGDLLVAHFVVEPSSS